MLLADIYNGDVQFTFTAAMNVKHFSMASPSLLLYHGFEKEGMLIHIS